MGDCRPEYARLCRLIIDSLQSYNKPQSLSPLTDERERHLLIILTKVSREIQGWDDVFDGEHSMGKEKSCHDCLNNIVLILVIFLGDESKYIRHSSSNVFVAISDYLLKSGSNWDGFLQLLCISLKVSATNILTSSSISSKTQTVGSDSDTISFILSVQQRLMTHANWFTVIGLVRVLRTILKHVRDENGDGDDLAEKYIDSIGICLGSIPWGLMSGQTMNSSMDVFHHGEFASQDTRFVFLGALLQLLCSLIGESSFAEAEDSTINKHPIFDTIITFVPELLYCCFHKEDGYDEVHSSQYLRHKMLVLMTRLSSQNHLESSILVLWLQLVRKYFEDLINQPISRHHANLSDCLEGSPFLACVSDGEFHSICTRHLQRQAIFIFLKLSLSLFSAGKDIDLRCSYATSSSSLTIDSQSALKCCTRKKGLSELSAWLERHLPMETLADFEMYLEKCANFASSFLQLFLEEDDFLFEVLLLLSKFPFFVQQMEFKSYRQAFEEAKENIMLHLSNILDPIHLFHIFLAEVHYDHLVLLDYLISKDTGIQCLQYLLRCLRLHNQSQHLFWEVLACGDETSWPSCKIRKISPDIIGSSPKVEFRSTNHELSNAHYATRKRNWENTKDCLLSLKKSVENLHQKNLFPYNPAALLKSFVKFQKLCQQQESVNLLKTGVET